MSCSKDISTSSISMSPATTGCHMLKIEGYSRTTKLLPNCACIMSSGFEAAGHFWRISYYPNGMFRDTADHISFYISLTRNVSPDTVSAKVRLSLVPHGGGAPAPATPCCDGLTAAFGAAPVTYYRFPRFVKREALEASGYLVDDCFAVRCDIEVVRSSAVAAADPAGVGENDLERLALPCATCHDHDVCRHFQRTVPDGGGVVDRSPAVAGRGCGCEDDVCKCRQRSVEGTAAPAPAPAPPQRNRRVVAAWFRLFGCGQI
ncbi:hypothetical protein ACP4OV_027907 [Aristida adscensionis]